MLNLLWQAAAGAQPSRGWSREYGWRWVETASAQTKQEATREVLYEFSLRHSWSSDIHESVRAQLYLRALCAMEWALTFREKKEPPPREELHDFVAWSMNTMWDEEGLAWAKRRLAPEGAMPPLPSPGPSDLSRN